MSETGELGPIKNAQKNFFVKNTDWVLQFAQIHGILFMEDSHAAMQQRRGRFHPCPKRRKRGHIM